MDKNISTTSWETEYKRAVYKWENGNTAEAEKIFEDLAITHDLPQAWAQLGAIKFIQINSGDATVQQALNCFTRASNLDLLSKELFQETYCHASLKSIQQYCLWYLQTKKEIGASTRKMWGNVALAGISLLVGNNTKNKTLGAIAGAGGAAAGAYGANRNRMQRMDAKQRLAFHEGTIRNLVAGVNQFCEDNQPLRIEFSKKIAALGEQNYQLKEILGSGISIG